MLQIAEDLKLDMDVFRGCDADLDRAQAASDRRYEIIQRQVDRSVARAACMRQ